MQVKALTYRKKDREKRNFPAPTPAWSLQAYFGSLPMGSRWISLTAEQDEYEMKKKGFSQCFGRRLAMVYKKYSHREASFSSWLRGKGIPSIVVDWVVRALKLIVAGVLLYIAFWGALFLIACLGLSAFLGAKGSDEDPVVGFQSDKLFPDHHSPKNSQDSKFN